MNNAHQDDGFTLLEVIVAFVILSVSLGILMQGFGSGIKSQSIAQNRSEMLVVAKNVLVEFGTIRPLTTGSYSGVVANRFNWQANISPYQTEPETVSVMAYWVQISVQQSNLSNLSLPSPVSLETLKTAR